MQGLKFINAGVNPPLLFQLVTLSAPSSVKCVIKMCLVVRGCKKKGTPRVMPFLTPAVPKQVCLSLLQDRDSTDLSDAGGLIFKAQPEPENKSENPICLIPIFHNSTI